jgi:hypothetical protein
MQKKKYYYLLHLILFNNLRRYILLLKIKINTLTVSIYFLMIINIFPLRRIFNYYNKSSFIFI